MDRTSTRNPYRTRHRNNPDHRIRRKDVDRMRREIRDGWSNPERRSLKNPIASLGLAILGHTRGDLLKCQDAYRKMVEARATAEVAVLQLNDALCDFSTRLADIRQHGQWVLGRDASGVMLEDLAIELHKNPERLQAAMFQGMNEQLVAFATANKVVECPLCRGKGVWEATA